jgi:hypothetical protein
MKQTLRVRQRVTAGLLWLIVALLGHGFAAPAGAAAAVLQRPAPFCQPDDHRWAGRLTGCRETPDGLRLPELLAPSDRWLEGLFRSPGVPPELLRLGSWVLNPTQVTGGPASGGASAAAPDPADRSAPGAGASDDWLTIQLDADGVYMFLGDPLTPPEDAALLGEEPLEVPSGIGIQKKWNF